MGEAIGNHVRGRSEGGAYDALEGQALADALQADARSIVDDRHMRVRFDAAHTNEPEGPAPGVVPGGAMPLEELRAQAAKVVTSKVLDSGLGYLKVDEFIVPEASGEVFAAALTVVREARALAIDLRSCRGGSDDAVAYLLSFLLDNPPQLVSTVVWRSGDVKKTMTRDVGTAAYGGTRPVFVLTSSRTFSGGEEFAYDVQAFKRGMIVGEVTGGGAHPTGAKFLGLGFIATVPMGRTVNPITGSNWETVGVQPDKVVAADDALATVETLVAKQVGGSNP
ncbi:S41 family peptidase [Pendulispora albinea]|uniref:S41 family peptidase n=1 Tax=Pendulispora albinea TaxID=2741071 RepID=A0ABZ2LV69_9BACT